MPTVTITEVRNAQSLNTENTYFDLEINHPEYGWIPYGLNPSDEDNTVDNAELLELIGSKFNAYVAPTKEQLDAELAESLRAERSRRLLEEVDPLVTNFLRWNELTEEKQEEWKQYRSELLDLPSQEGFPNTATWPTKPE